MASPVLTVRFVDQAGLVTSDGESKSALHVWQDIPAVHRLALQNKKREDTETLFMTGLVTCRHSSSLLRVWSHQLRPYIAGCIWQTVVMTITTIRISIARWYWRYRRRRRFVVASIAAIREEDEMNESDIGRINCGLLYL